MPETRYDYDCDVLIIGAGIAGSSLARHLKLEMPDLDVVVVEEKSAFDAWVGESTVETFDKYLEWACGLGPYLEKNYINKQGLRYFFDTPEANLEVADMSECGRTVEHQYRASQVDRDKLDTDLVRFNREAGVKVLLGTRVKGGRSGDQVSSHIRLDAENGHIIETTAGDIRCKWIVDAGGRGAPLARMLDVFRVDKRMPVTTYWARYRGFNNIDYLGDEAWRARANYHSRYLATCHFMYRGYWIWAIPLTEDTTSFGVCWHQDKAPYQLKLRNGHELDRFFRSHRALDQILGNGEQLDFRALPYAAQYSTQRFSEDRWYITGMASCVIDALNSNTSRIFPENNTYIVELIKADREGKRDKLKAYLKHFNLRMQQVYDGTYEAYRHYELYGSYDVGAPYVASTISTYYNSILNDCVHRYRFMRDLAEQHGVDCACDEESAVGFNKQTLGALARPALEAAEYLEKTGKYHAHNKGRFWPLTFLELRPGLFDKLVKPRDLEAEQRENAVTYEYVVRNIVELLADHEGRKFDESAFRRAFDSSRDAGHSVVDLLQRSSSDVVAVPR